MNARRLILLFALLAASTGQRLGARPEDMTQIAPGVWFREGAFEPFGFCNNVVIEMKDFLIVVDANFPGAVPEIKADIARLSSKPVKFVLLTHHHGDHAYGSSLWTRDGAITVAYREVAGEMSRFEPARWHQAIVDRVDIAALKMDAPEPPKQTFSDSPMVFDDGVRRVEFHHFGYGHSRGDGFIYLPKEEILCTGDAAVNGPFNATGDSYLGNWPKELAFAARRPIAHVLPGHGKAGGLEILTGQAQFLTELYETVRTGRLRGQTLAEIQAAVHYSQAVQRWVGNSTKIKNQLGDVWEEIQAGQPRGELPHSFGVKPMPLTPPQKASP